MKKFVAGIMALLILFVIAAGCSSNPENSEVINSPTPTSGIGVTNQMEAPQESWKAVLFFSDKDAMYLVKEERNLSSGKNKDINERAQILLEELLKGAESKDLSTTIPKTTKIRSVSIEEDTAIVDLSREFVQDNVGGSAGEMMAIAPIILTLTELEVIKQVGFKIDGQIQNEFKGHYELERPFKRSDFERYISK